MWWIAALIAGSTGAVVLDIESDCGAVGDNRTLATLAINDCVKRASPGDTVLVPRGVFLTGTIALTSGLTLRFSDGGFLQGSADPSQYSTSWDAWHVVSAVGAVDLRIVADTRGGGGIVGAMWQMVAGWDASQEMYAPASWAGVGGCVGECRPKNLGLADVRGLELRNLALLDSSDWTVLLRRCSDVLADSLVIRGSRAWPNNDGIDIESGNNIALLNLDIETGDDCIAMRSGNCNTLQVPWPAPIQPLFDVRVLNCTLASSSAAIKIENLFQADHGDVHDVLVDGIRIHDSNRGVGVWQRVSGPSGGRMSNLTVRNAVIETRYMAGTAWWGSGEALVVTSVPENAAQARAGLPGIHGVVFENVDAVAEGGCLFSSRGQEATSPLAITGLELRNVRLAIGRAAGDPATHAQLDFRPVDAGGGAPELVPAPVAGLVFEHVHDALVVGGGVSFVGPPQPYWAGPGGVGACLQATNDSGVVVRGSFSCALALAPAPVVGAGPAAAPCGSVVAHVDYDEGSGGPNAPAASPDACCAQCVAAGPSACWAAVFSATGCWLKTRAQTDRPVYNAGCTACWPAGRIAPSPPPPPPPPPPGRYGFTVLSEPAQPRISFLAGDTPWPQSFNPAFVQASAATGGQSGLLVRSQNCTGWTPGQCISCNVDKTHPIAPWFPGSVLSFAPLHGDGSFGRPYLVFAPDQGAPTPEDFGTEDPRLTLDASTGLYHLFYTCYSSTQGARLCHATTRDPTQPLATANWTRLGSVFPSKGSGPKSGALLIDAAPEGAPLHHLYWGAGTIALATSPDLVTWTTVNDSFIAPRPGGFDDTLVESGPSPQLLSDGNLVFFHNSMNSSGCYNPTYAIINGSAPSTLVERAPVPILTPSHDWEMGTAPAECNVRCVVFLEAVAPVAGLPDAFDVWFGGSDAVVGTARIQITIAPPP